MARDKLHDNIKKILLDKVTKMHPGETMDEPTLHLLDIITGEIIRQGYNAETATKAVELYEKEMNIIENAKENIPKEKRCTRAEFDFICDQMSALVVDKIRGATHMPDQVKEMFWATAQYLLKEQVRDALEDMFNQEYKAQRMREHNLN